PGLASVDTARVLEALPQAILAIDASFAIRYVNAKAEEFFYASAATMVGSELSELIPADSPVFSLIRQVLRTAAPVVDHGLILDETAGIKGLIDRMEIFSDDLPVAREAVNIHTVLDQVRKVAAASYGRHVNFVERYDPSLPPVYGNREQLVRLFTNLVKNAA